MNGQKDFFLTFRSLGQGVNNEEKLKKIVLPFARSKIILIILRGLLKNVKKCFSNFFWRLFIEVKGRYLQIFRKKHLVAGPCEKKKLNCAVHCAVHAPSVRSTKFTGFLEFDS